MANPRAKEKCISPLDVILKESSTRGILVEFLELSIQMAATFKGKLLITSHQGVESTLQTHSNFKVFFQTLDLYVE